MQAFRRSAGSRGLRRVPLGLAQLGHGDGKLSELSDEHHHSGLVLVAHRRRERKQLAQQHQHENPARRLPRCVAAKPGQRPATLSTSHMTEHPG
jgi:hypothetical protein